MSPSPSPAPGSSGVSKVKHQIISISVDLGVTTPDNLRHIDFGLSKDTADDGTITWLITFKFQERAKTSDAFVDVVTLSVKVKSKNNPAAEATAKDGLSDNQIDHLNGPVTVASQKKLPQAQLSNLVEGTIPKH